VARDDCVVSENKQSSLLHVANQRSEHELMELAVFDNKIGHGAENSRSSSFLSATSPENASFYIAFASGHLVNARCLIPDGAKLNSFKRKRTAVEIQSAAFH